LVLIIEGTEDLRVKDLLAQLKLLLPLHGCPKKIYYLPEFVRTESLKIKRKETLALL